MVIQAIAVLKEELAKHLGWDVARAQLAADSGSLTLYNQGCLAAVRGDNRKALDLIVAAVRGQRLTELRGTMLDPDLASIREQAALVAAIAEREAELLNKR